MQSRRWVNRAQPQTLYIAVMLLYLGAAFLMFDMLRFGTFPLIFLGVVAGQVVAGYGVANEKKWGYWLAIGMAILPFALRFYYLGNPLEAANVVNLMIEIALVALLLHPQSREYQRIWFK